MKTTALCLVSMVLVSLSLARGAQVAEATCEDGHHTQAPPFTREPVPRLPYEVWIKVGSNPPIRAAFGERLGPYSADQVRVRVEDPTHPGLPIVSEQGDSLWSAVSGSSSERGPLLDGSTLANTALCDSNNAPSSTQPPPQAWIRARDDGFDVEFDYDQPTSLPRMLGQFRLGGMRFGRSAPAHGAYGRVGTRRFEYDGQEQVLDPANMGFPYAVLGSYPDGWYSPLATIRSEEYTIGVSLQYDIRQYKHDLLLELFSFTSPDDSWTLAFTPEAHAARETTTNGCTPIARIWGEDLLIAPGSNVPRRYVMSVRVLRTCPSQPLVAAQLNQFPAVLQEQDWMWTLSPYVRYFKTMTAGSPRHAKRPDPLLYRFLALRQTQVCPTNEYAFEESYGIPEHGWKLVIEQLKADVDNGWQREMLWNVGGVMPSYKPDACTTTTLDGWGPSACGSCPDTVLGRLLHESSDSDYNFPSYLAQQWDWSTPPALPASPAPTAPAMSGTLPTLFDFLTETPEFSLGFWWGYSSRPFSGWMTPGFHTYSNGDPADAAWQEAQLGVAFEGAGPGRVARVREIGLDTFHDMPMWEAAARLANLAHEDPSYSQLRYVTESRGGDLLHLLSATYVYNEKIDGSTRLLTPHYLADLLHVAPQGNGWGGEHETWAQILFRESQCGSPCHAECQPGGSSGCHDLFVSYLRPRAIRALQLGYVPLIPAYNARPDMNVSVEEVTLGQQSVNTSLTTVPPLLRGPAQSIWFYPDMAAMDGGVRNAGDGFLVDRHWDPIVEAAHPLPGSRWGFEIRTDAWGPDLYGRHLVGTLTNPADESEYTLEWWAQSDQAPGSWFPVATVDPQHHFLEPLQGGRVMRLRDPSNALLGPLAAYKATTLKLKAVAKFHKGGTLESVLSESFVFLFEGECHDVDFNNDGIGDPPNMDTQDYFDAIGEIANLLNGQPHNDSFDYPDFDRDSQITTNDIVTMEEIFLGNSCP